MKKEKTKAKPYRSVLSNSLWSVRLQLKYTPWALLILFLGVPVGVALSYCRVYLPSLVVREATESQPFADVVLTVGIFFLISALLRQAQKIMKSFIVTVQTRYNDWIAYRVDERSMSCLYEEYERKETRDLRQRASRATGMWNGTQAVTDFPERVFSLLENLLSYLLFGGIIASFSPWLIPFVMLSPLVDLICTRAYQRWYHSRREYDADLRSRLGYAEELPDDFAAGKDIRIYGMAGWLRDTWKMVFGEWNDWYREHGKRRFLSQLGSLFVILLRDGAAYAVLIAMVLRGEVTVDEFVLYFAAISDFAGFFGGIVSEINGLNDLSLSICDVREYLDFDLKNQGGTETAERHLIGASQIEFDHVSFRYAGAEEDTVKDLSLTIRSGESIALVGLNGAGKTTLVKLLCGLCRPTSGEIRINGVPTSEFVLEEYYRLFSPVFQDSKTAFFSLAETVSGKSGKDMDLARVERCIHRVGLGEKVRSLPNGIHSRLDKQFHADGIELSGGEVQKLMMARALYKDAPVLVLDEPTAALDPIAESKVYEEYRSMTVGKTSLFISHRLASTRFCDRVIYMENGRITEEGSHDDLVAAGGAYSRLYAIQSCWYRDDYGKGDAT
ncbi:MAG: ABC transporter ATP-binding protein [Clostridia bacterium]|nr:ABC transporter ATP-binding protein [Clostridia bacterium]